MVEDNVRLKFSNPPRSPNTPTSPLPVIKESSRAKKTEGKEVEEDVLEMYAMVDKSKVNTCCEISA